MITSQSAEWAEEKAWILEQITAAHQALEDENLTDIQTAVLRGEVKAWRRRIELAERFKMAPPPPTRAPY